MKSAATSKNGWAISDMTDSLEKDLGFLISKKHFILNAISTKKLNRH